MGREILTVAETVSNEKLNFVLRLIVKQVITVPSVSGLWWRMKIMKCQHAKTQFLM